MNNRFDKLAPWYLFLEKFTFGNQLQKCRITQIEKLKDAKNVLLLGDGNGRFLQSFIKTNKSAKIDSLDISKKMITLAQNRVALIPIDHQVNFIHKDVFKWEFPKTKYDLIVTNFFLDCFTFQELTILTEKISYSIKPEGKLLYGDFNIPKARFKKILILPLLNMMYLFFKIFTHISAQTLSDPAQLFTENGFILENEKQQLGSLLKSQIWIKA